MASSARLRAIFAAMRARGMKSNKPRMAKSVSTFLQHGPGKMVRARLGAVPMSIKTRVGDRKVPLTDRERRAYKAVTARIPHPKYSAKWERARGLVADTLAGMDDGGGRWESMANKVIAHMADKWHKV